MREGEGEVEGGSCCGSGWEGWMGEVVLGVGCVGERGRGEGGCWGEWGGRCVIGRGGRRGGEG